ncbi:MAG TPA: hypothetical protein VJR47_03070 [Stellaceae bacterium]|nr:hypothetical protein [Stellaceae bacterium]
MTIDVANSGPAGERRAGAWLFGAMLCALLPIVARAQTEPVQIVEAPEAAAPAQPAPDTYTPEQRDFLAALDRDLAAQDYNTLARQILDPKISAHLKPALDWTRTGTLSGRSIIVPLIYASLLWELGANYPQFADFKISSGIVALYALLVAHADGFKCADPTAPSHRVDVIGAQYRGQFATLAGEPEAKRRDAINAAINMERTTSELRSNDKYLCRFGMQETLDDLQKHQGEPVAAKPKSAFAGFEIELPRDATYEPSFLPRDEWAKKQAKARAGFPAMLTAFLAKYKSSARHPQTSALPEDAAPSR